VSASKHGGADRHEVCDIVVAIADELGSVVLVRGRERWEIWFGGGTSWRLLAMRACIGHQQDLENFKRDRETHTRFRVIELHSSCETSLREEAEL
jgi:hypothetical protein